MGIYRGKVLWAGRNTGGEYFLHGDWSVCGAGLCVAPVQHRIGTAGALYFIVLQFVIITALALFFSSFSSPIFSAVFTFSLFVIGSFGEDLRGFAAMTHGVAGWLATGAAYLVPNFSALNVISQAAHGEAVTSQLIFQYCSTRWFTRMAVLGGAVLIFERRNLK